MKKVRILGAGISGMSAAINLAKFGLEAEVFEEREGVGNNSGNFTSTIRNYEDMDALEDLRRFGIELEATGKVGRVIKKSPNFVSEVRGESYYLLERGDEGNSLERQLYRKALDLGVKFYFGTKASEKEADVVATGVPAKKANIFGAGYLFTMKGSGLKQNELALIYDNRISPSGYLCIIPGIRNLTVLSVSFSETDVSGLRNRLDEALQSDFFLKQMISGSRKIDRIEGSGFYEQDPIFMARRGKKLYVGEAGGFQDARRGFGIRYALITGHLAALSMAAGIDYVVLLMNRFKNEFLMLQEERERLNRAKNEDYDSWLSRMGKTTDIEKYRKWKRFF